MCARICMIHHLKYVYIYTAFVHLFIQVLELLWNLAHRDDCPTDTMDHALNAHIKILDYSCSQVSYPHVLYCVCSFFCADSYNI